MARTKQTARPKDIKAIKVARAELFGPSTDNPSGQLTLVPIGQSEPSELFSFRSCISAPKVDSNSDPEEEVHKGVPSFISEQSEMAKDSDLWPIPTDLKIENIGLHSEPVVSWCVDYYEKPRSKEGSEIVLRIVFEDSKGKEKTKDLGVVLYTKDYADAIDDLRFKLLESKKSTSNITEYVASKGLKLGDNVESTEASTSSLHSGKQGSQAKSDKGPVPTQTTSINNDTPDTQVSVQNKPASKAVSKQDDAANSDHGDSKPPKPKRKAKVTFDRPSGFVPGVTTVDGDQETTGVKMFIGPNNKKKIEDDWEELNRCSSGSEAQDEKANLGESPQSQHSGGNPPLANPVPHFGLEDLNERTFANQEMIEAERQLLDGGGGDDEEEQEEDDGEAHNGGEEEDVGEPNGDDEKGGGDGGDEENGGEEEEEEEEEEGEVTPSR
ncbi:hypothetical protein R1sor_012476 [Riccia sorocarpa]|uniref:Uncharacterized protein n=1 Tax=Riccia sorocarpa TaxID=122646 RepID=A0ABD3I3W2_9MARC